MKMLMKMRMTVIAKTTRAHPRKRQTAVQLTKMMANQPKSVLRKRLLLASKY
jgi:hypothetical protein